MSSNLLVCLLVVCLTSVEAIRPYRVTGIITCKSSPGASVPMFNEEIEVVAVSASGLSEAIGDGFSAQDETFVVFPVNKVKVNAIEAAVHCNSNSCFIDRINTKIRDAFQQKPKMLLRDRNPNYVKNLCAFNILHPNTFSNLSNFLSLGSSWMMVFGLVLGGCWKSMFKRFNIGAVLMLLFVVLTTMFVAAEPTSCWKANTLEGSCSVNVTTNASSIKATMEIKEGTNKFGGSITIGSCNIPGTFFSVSQTFEPDTDTSDLFKSPIKVEATSTAVTFQSGTNPKKTLCPSSPFDVQDGLVRTTITLKLESGNIVSLKLDNSISIDNNEKSEKASSVWGIVLICLGASALFIVIVVIIVVVWCCCYRKKKQPVAVSEFKIPDQFEWPSDRFTAEQLDQLLVLFPVLELSAKELDFRTDALLKEHPIKTKGQWDYIKKIRNTYKCKMEKEFLMNREAKPTRAYCMFTIFDSIVHWRPTSESLKKFGNEKTKVTLKQEGPIEKKEVPLEAKKEDQLGTKKEGGLIEKK